MCYTSASTVFVEALTLQVRGLWFENFVRVETLKSMTFSWTFGVDAMLSTTLHPLEFIVEDVSCAQAKKPTSSPPLAITTSPQHPPYG